jgi:hypothetical protein
MVPKYHNLALWVLFKNSSTGKTTMGPNEKSVAMDSTATSKNEKCTDNLSCRPLQSFRGGGNLIHFKTNSENCYLDIGSIDSDNLVPGLQGPILRCRGVVENLPRKDDNQNRLFLIMGIYCKLAFKSQKSDN